MNKIKKYQIYYQNKRVAKYVKNIITIKRRLPLILANKMDITYHRTKNSSIQYKMNKKVQKIKSVDIKITEKNLIVIYKINNDFNIKF